MLFNRQIFSVFTTTLLLVLAGQARATPESGWWWNAAEGGRGFTIEVQNGMMFMAGYMYDETGRPTWYASGPTAMVNDSTYRGVWQQYGGGQTLNGAYQSPTVWNGSVGNITLTFSGTKTGTLVLPNGRSIALTRFSFGGTGETTPPATAACTPANFTTAKYNAITQGMTLNQVSQVIGCVENGSLTQRTSNFNLHAWAASNGAMISVYTDTSDGNVIDIFHGATGTTPTYKRSMGF